MTPVFDKAEHVLPVVEKLAASNDLEDIVALLTEHLSPFGLGRLSLLVRNADDGEFEVLGEELRLTSSDLLVNRPKAGENWFLVGPDARLVVHSAVELSTDVDDCLRLTCVFLASAIRNVYQVRILHAQTQQVNFERFEAEKRLRQLKRYANLFASAAEGIAVVGVDGRVVFANPRAFEVVGTAEIDATQVRLLDRLHTADVQRVRELWRAFDKGEYPRGVDIRFRHENGTYLVCSCSFAPLSDTHGSILVSFSDVTEQRRTEAEFIKTMEFLESLIDASVDGIVAADMSGNVILFNQGAETIYGWNAEDVVGKQNVRSLYPPGVAREVMRRILDERDGGPGRLGPTQLAVLGRSGEEIPIRLSAAMIYERGEPVATFGIFTDLREKLRVEERLAEAQEKLATTEKQAILAELAGTAAHELNQPLTSIMAYAELLHRRFDPDTPEHRTAATMLREAERMAEIVRKIGRMTRYETKSYVGSQRILDLDASADEGGGG